MPRRAASFTSGEMESVLLVGPGSAQVQLRRELLGSVVGLGDAVGAEGVGLEDVGAGREIRAVHLLHHVGPGQHQQLVVAGWVVGMFAEALAPEVGLGQALCLEHGPHGPVDHEDPLGEQAFELVASLGSGHGHKSYRNISLSQ
jgi:hypothetical protein